MAKPFIIKINFFKKVAIKALQNIFWYILFTAHTKGAGTFSI